MPINECCCGGCCPLIRVITSSDATIYLDKTVGSNVWTGEDPYAAWTITLISGVWTMTDTATGNTYTAPGPTTNPCPPLDAGAWTHTAGPDDLASVVCICCRCRDGDNEVDGDSNGATGTATLSGMGITSHGVVARTYTTPAITYGPTTIPQNLGPVTFSTGALTSGSIATGGTFAGGGSLTFIANGTDYVAAKNCVIFTGSFTGPLAWTLTSPPGDPALTYTLTGTFFAMFCEGMTITGSFTATFTTTAALLASGVATVTSVVITWTTDCTMDESMMTGSQPCVGCDKPSPAPHNAPEQMKRDEELLK